MKDPPYARTYNGYRKESVKQCLRQWIRGKTGEGHPKSLHGKQQQCPDEQCLRQTVNDRNRLETVAFGVPVIQVHGLSNVEVSIDTVENDVILTAVVALVSTRPRCSRRRTEVMIMPKMHSNNEE